ncbi:MAG: T9SS type A sorting domain-containing protein [Saprospiraceae bacterium]|nr:MAG: T9SS type A sorting domain-containing protein [Saprospiraceae bacterium]
MKVKITHLFLSLLLSQCPLFSQTSQDKVVPITVTVQTSPPQVTLDWNNGTDTAGILLFRRLKDAPDWYLLMEDAATTTTTFTDTFVELGMTYEYGIERLSGGIYAYGYATVPVEAPLTDNRGTVLIFVEEALQVPLAGELDQFGKDLNGDGWQVIWHPVAAGATVASVKNQIIADYANGANAALLLGEIPVPYSGNTNWDGHPDHQGAWPADSYYGDVDGNWTDASVNNSTPNRPENDNVPGDGKFDQSTTPSALEIAVGRVDFSNLSETTFGATQVELYRRYLNKNHNWRTKQYSVANKVLVDDNFGYFGGEAFGANGWRNGYPLVGVDSVVAGDFFGDTDGAGFLMGDGCGGGNYTGAGGVGNSTQFATDSVNIVFSMLFGSYFGDWDYSPNPFMPSALASKGGILSCSWAGRPHWFYHHLAAGQTLGYCALATQNACDNPGYFGSLGDCGAHVTLLGDPTLRAQIVAPAADFVAVNKCSSVGLSWQASPAPGLLGYHVYRATAQNGEYERLTAAPVIDTFFEDESPAEDTLYYQVRAVVLENTPTGSFYNNSTGVFSNTVFAFGEIPSVAFTGDTITCLNPVAIVTAVTDAQSPIFVWMTPGGTVEGPTVEIDQPGNYIVTVTAGATGCFTVASPTLTNNTVLPVAFPAGDGEITCAQTAVQLIANPAVPGYSFDWSGPGGFSSNEENTIATEAGVYVLTVTDPANGCKSEYSVFVVEDTIAPLIELGPPVQLNCAVVSFLFTCSPIPSTSCILTDENGNVYVPPVTLTQAGLYILTLINLTNGCTSTGTLVVVMDTVPPDLSVTGIFEITCQQPAVLNANSNTPGVSFFWTGPGVGQPSDPQQTVTEPGIYTVVATDTGSGCTSSETVIVTGGIPMEPAIEIITDCQGFSEIVLQVIGGTPPYSYQITPQPPIPPATFFTIIITDAEGCIAIINGVTPSFIPVTVSISHTNETVAGANDGTATAQPNGGNPPYEYLWSDGQTAQTATGLAPGDYTVVVTDANGCTAVESVTIEAGIDATAEVPGLRSLTLFPNPAGEQCSLDLVLENSALVSVEMQDVTGRTLLKSAQERVLEKHWEFDLSSYNAGVYFCKIWIDGQAVSRKVVKIE